ncbi:MAG: NDP-sugar synthase [Desulfurococcaceae archaeon]
MVQAVVLAGGVGSRLHPLTRVVPKPLIPFAGSPLVEYIVDKLLREGFKEVIVTAKYLGEQIVEYFKKKPDVKPLLLNSKDTADAVRLVADHLKADFIVSMGDVVTDTPFNQFFKAHRDKGVLASIALKQVDNPLPYGLVYVDENGFISLFTEKPRSLEVYLLTLAHYRVKGSSLYSNLVNAGIYAFKKEILDILASNQGLMDFGRHVFPYLLEAGYRIYGWIAPENTYWNDIGRPSVYKEALWDFLSGKVKNWTPRGESVSAGVYLARNAEVEGTLYPPVFIGRDVVVEQGAVVGPYVVLENGAVVKKGSRLMYSVVWHNTIVEEGAQVYDSIIMNNAVLKQTVKIVSSIVGTGCSVTLDLYNKSLEPCSEVPPYAHKG